MDGMPMNRPKMNGGQTAEEIKSTMAYNGDTGEDIMPKNLLRSNLNIGKNLAINKLPNFLAFSASILGLNVSAFCPGFDTHRLARNNKTDCSQEKYFIGIYCPV
jgi:hypothetical protein